MEQAENEDPETWAESACEQPITRALGWGVPRVVTFRGTTRSS